MIDRFFAVAGMLVYMLTGAALFWAVFFGLLYTLLYVR